MKSPKLFLAFPALLLLFLLSGVSGCTGDDTVTNTVTSYEQCSDGTRVNLTAGEKCPPVQPPDDDDDDDTSTTTDDDDDTSRGADECRLVKGTQTFNAGDGDDKICGDDTDNTINGGKGRDTIYGRGGNDKLTGGDADDKLYGEGGNDELTGGEGRDLLDGGEGNDKLTGGKDEDTLNGGPGSDTVKYGDSTIDGSPTMDINLSAGFSVDEYGYQDEFQDIENIEYTGSNAAMLTGNNGNNVITGGDGGDTINGGGGDDKIKNADSGDTIDGGEGEDTLDFSDQSTTAPIVSLDTYPSIENLIGSAAAETSLTGNDNNNKLDGHSGDTSLSFTGGVGNDNFIVRKGNGSYTIVDFNIKTEKDKVYLCGFASNARETITSDNVVTIEGQTITFTTNADGFDDFIAEASYTTFSDPPTADERTTLAAEKKAASDILTNVIVTSSGSNCTI